MCEMVHSEKVYSKEGEKLLLFLFVLSLISLVLSFMMNTRIKKQALETSFDIIAFIQGGTLGALVIILLILLIKGRTLG